MSKRSKRKRRGNVKVEVEVDTAFAEARLEAMKKRLRRPAPLPHTAHDLLKADQPRPPVVVR